MLIVCPSCATSYDIEAASLMPNGRQVRCVRCRAVWRAQPNHADRLMAAADAIAPAREMVEVGAGAPPSREYLAEDVVFAEGDPVPAETAMATDAADTAVEVEAPPIAPTGDESAPAETAAEPAEHLEDIETYAARQEKLNRKGWLRWPLSNLQSVILVLLVVDAIVVGWRNDFVRVFPQTASFYGSLGLPVNLRGVTLSDIATTTEQHEGVPILVVEGNIANATRGMIDVPRLKFVVRNGAGAEVYSWTAVPPRATLPPGETVAFRSRLASPPPDGSAVLVRFVTRHDIISGNR